MNKWIPQFSKSSWIIKCAQALLLIVNAMKSPLIYCSIKLIDPTAKYTLAKSLHLVHIA